MSMAVAKTRASPFRESEWDRRLDGLLQDLENSTQISESRQVSYSRVQHHNHSVTKSKIWVHFRDLVCKLEFN